MSLDAIQTEAESFVKERLKTLEEKIVVLIARGGAKLDGYLGQALRTGVAFAIKEEFDAMVSPTNPMVQAAAKEGIGRATTEAGIHVGAVSVDLSPFKDAIAVSFHAASKDLEKWINLPLARAALGSGSVSLADALDVGEAFKKASERVRGILYNELQIAYSYAYHKQIAYIEQHSKRQVQPTTGKDNKVRVAITVWRHSAGGNPPRANHLAMDGKGVVAGHLFKLDGRDGGVYHTIGPHLPPLPAGEIINCHCVEITVVLYVTPDELRSLIERSLSTGGFLDKRWN